MPLTTIEQVTETKIKRAGRADRSHQRYTFRLDEPIAHDISLAFYTTHQYAAVYLDGGLVCSLQPAGEHRITKTLGSNWVMIPLYAEDSGKTDETDDQPGRRAESGGDHQGGSAEYEVPRKITGLKPAWVLCGARQVVPHRRQTEAGGF